MRSSLLWARCPTLRRGAALFALVVFSLSAQAQPACESLYEEAQQQIEVFQPRAADSLDVEVVRGALREARACYAREPAFDSTAASHFGRLYGREVQVLWETRRPDEAAALTDTFLSGPHLRADSSGVRYLLEWRAFILDQQGDFEAAAQTRVQLLDYAPSATPAVRTRIWMDLGANYSRLGWWDDALAIYRSVQEELGGQPDLEPALRVNLARALDKEAEVRLLQKHLPPNVERSLEASREAVRLLSLGESSLEQHYRVFAHITLAEALRTEGRPDSALVAAQRAADLAGRLVRPSLSAEITSWEQVGGVLADLHRYEAATAAFEHALAIGERNETPLRRIALLEQLADVSIRTGDYVRADSLVNRTLHLVEAERASLSAKAEASRANSWYGAYLVRVGLLLRQQRPEAAFLALDGARARVLRDLRRHRFNRLLPETQRVSDSLAAVLGDLHDRLADPASTMADVLRLRSRVNKAEEQRAALYGEGAGVQEVTLPRLQTALAEREQVLLTYYLAPPAHAFVLRPDTLLAVPLDPAVNTDHIRALMGAVSPQWNQAAGPISVADASFELAPLKALYDLLFAPVAPHIAEGVPLVVVPEGPLAQLPFGLLVEAAPGRFQFAEAPFLLRRHPISTELAAALLLDPASSASVSQVVAFGRSEFGGVEEDSPLRSAYGDEAPPDLPSVVREIEGLARRFPSAHVALNEAATESSFYRLAGEARLLHLASHAFVAETDPLNSYVQLTPDPDSTEDGRLHLHELLNRPLLASLVVLSGCRTARGRDLHGEGTLGLHYAVRAAGAGSSLGTLWRVDDAATVELMEAFYEHLARGDRKDVALQRAQIAYLEANDGFRASPFFWAAPLLYGDPGPISLPTSTGFPWWMAGAGLLALAFLLPVVRRRFVREG